MANARASFADLVKIAFQDNDVKKRCTNVSTEMLRQNIATRAFDEFPCLLSHDTLNVYCKNFIDIVEAIISFNDEFTLTAEQDKKAIKKYIKTIAEIACTDLLDEKGQVKTEIIALLGWQEYERTLKSRDIVSAFIGAVNMQVIKQLSAFVQNKESAFLCFVNFVNKNYHGWVKETLKELSFPASIADAKADLIVMDLIRYSAKKPLATAGIFAGIAFFAWAGLSFFASKQNPASNSTPNEVFPTRQSTEKNSLSR